MVRATESRRRPASVPFAAALAAYSAICAGLSAGCGDAPGGPAPRNLLLVTLDTTRADALGCYGGFAAVTPHLDRLASEGVVYANARSVAPLTLPAHASMLTGLYPPRHTVRDNGLAPLPQGARTLAEAARDAGLETGAFVSSTALDRAFALDQGFATWEQPARPEAHVLSTFRETNAAEVTRAARRWLGARPTDRGFFLWLHYFDPHVPYDPPSSFLVQANRDPYLGEIARMDASIGELLSSLEADGTLDETLVIVVGDHGESLGQHGEPTHGAYCYDATIRVPLIVRWPDGRRAGEVSKEVVSVADVFPTAMEALGLGEPGGVDGVSLASGEVPEDRGVYFESYSGWLNFGWSPLAGWLDRRGKYLHSSDPEFYAPHLDPMEATDIAEVRAADLERYRRAIADVAEAPALEAEEGRFEDALLADLRQLGYGVTGKPRADIPHPLEPTDRPAPASRAGELQPLLVATSLSDQGRYAEAIPILEAIVAENGGNALANDVLGFALMQQRRFDEALAIFQRRLTFGPQRSDTHTNLGVCYEARDELGRAQTHFDAALRIDPEAWPALEGALRVREARGDAEGAAEVRARMEAIRSR